MNSTGVEEWNIFIHDRSYTTFDQGGEIILLITFTFIQNFLANKIFSNIMLLNLSSSEPKDTFIIPAF